MANLPGTAQQLFISLQAYLGAPDYTHNTILDYVSPSTLTGIVYQSIPYSITNGASYTAVALGTLFPAVANAILLAVYDNTVPAQTFGVSTVNGSGSVTISAGGFWSYMPNGGALPTIYISNANATTGLLQICCFSN